VSGRGTYDRAYDLERAGVFDRLVDEHRVTLLDAELWLRRWEAKADDIGRPRTSRDFWLQGWQWINGELAAEHRKTD
jgi:hypothetical protein